MRSNAVLQEGLLADIKRLVTQANAFDTGDSAQPDQKTKMQEWLLKLEKVGREAGATIVCIVYGSGPPMS